MMIEDDNNGFHSPSDESSKSRLPSRISSSVSRARPPLPLPSLLEPAPPTSSTALCCSISCMGLDPAPGLSWHATIFFNFNFNFFLARGKENREGA